jgi:hypothetical protein
MTTAELFVQLRQQLTAAAQPGLAGVRALAAAAQTAAELEDAVRLIEQRHADREAVRLGHIVRHALAPEQYYRAEQAARAEHPEAWVGRLPAVLEGVGRLPAVLEGVGRLPAVLEGVVACTNPI